MLSLQRIFVAVAMVLLPSSATASPIDQLREQLQNIIATAAVHDNTSFSLGLHVGDTLIAVANGTNDRHTAGSVVSVSSQFPAGSVAKAFLAVGALRLSERGVLDLDAPVLPVVDPWLKAQGLPTLSTMWGPEHLRNLSLVTPRLLLTMQSGLQDYNDEHMREWQRAHPGEDFLPHQWLQNLTKTFLYPPGGGVSYSSDGFVLAGMMLAAVTNASSWDKFSQLEHAVGGISPPFLGLRFMGRGPCSQYPGVVHQYGIMKKGRLHARSAVRGGETCNGAPVSNERVTAGRVFKRGAAHDAGQCCDLANQWARGANERMVWVFKGGDCTAYDQMAGGAPDPSATFGHANWPATCDGRGVMSGVDLRGDIAQTVHVASTQACCAAAEAFAHPRGERVMWAFSNASCRIYDHVQRKQPGTAHVGFGGPMPPPPRPAGPQDVYDLYNESCLNGWTMGNIAPTPSDLARFYQLLFNGRVVSQDSLAQMTRWRNFSSGWNKGNAKYGMGLLMFPAHQQLANGSETNVTYLVGHPGADWGSGIMVVGHYPHLNASIALATNSMQSLNFSKAAQSHRRGNTAFIAKCQIEDRLIQFLRPGSPHLACPQFD